MLNGFALPQMINANRLRYAERGKKHCPLQASVCAGRGQGGKRRRSLGHPRTGPAVAGLTSLRLWRVPGFSPSKPWTSGLGLAPGAPDWWCLQTNPNSRNPDDKRELAGAAGGESRRHMHEWCHLITELAGIRLSHAGTSASFRLRTSVSATRCSPPESTQRACRGVAAADHCWLAARRRWRPRAAPGRQ